MQSPPSLPLPRRGRTATRHLKLHHALSGLAALLLLAGCGSTGGAGGVATPPTSQRLPNLAASEEPFLVSPLAGYLLRVPYEVEARLEEAHRGMLERGDLASVEEAREVARQLLDDDFRLHPATVLLAQTDFANGLYGQAVGQLRRVTAELPGFLAAQLLLGRSAEKLGDLPLAYAAYRAAAEGRAEAGERATAIRARTLEIVANRLREGLRRGRFEEAERELDLLLQWAPGDPVTLEARAEVARVRGDAGAELSAVRDLARLQPDDEDLAERWADLELDAGNPATGLELIEKLAVAHPSEGRLQEKLGYAKFRWRLTLLPQRVQQIAGASELERGEWAALLYWLLPSVRYGRPDRARIAADILDDPRREEIARVVNLGLMDINESLHRFSPEEPVRRAQVLGSLLRVLRTADPPVACVQGLPGSPSVELTCETAARCGLLPRSEECLPAGTVSGREGIAFLRRTLGLVEAR